MSSALKSNWKVNLKGKLSNLVAADGKLFLASIDEHTVYALEAESGKILWNYTAGGRVDSPPTIYHGCVLFGSSDGWVYCLDVSNGELVWRFRAAPLNQRHVAYGQVESAWPVHGSVLVQDGIVYCIDIKLEQIDSDDSLKETDSDEIDYAAVDRIVSLIENHYSEGEAYHLVTRLIEKYQLVVNSDAILEPEQW